MEHTKQPEKTTPVGVSDGSKQNLPAVKEDIGEHENYGRSNTHQFILNELMDTPEDKAKFKILRSLDGKIYNSGSNTMYSVVFTVKRGIYNPVVVFDNGYITVVENRVAELIAQILAYAVDETKPKPLYPDIKSIPDYEKYQFFRYNGVIYKFTMPVFWNDGLEISSISDNVVRDVIDGRIYTTAIYNDVLKEITDYFFHPSKYEYDVMCAFSFMTYIYQMMGKVLYLTFFGGPGTGKTWGIELLSYLMKNGYTTGKGTIPSTVRKIEYQQIALAQDEFEKMNKEERRTFIGVMNAGFNPNKRYDITNMAVKDLTKQSVGFRTFCPKVFTCNSLYGFELSFLDRLYVIHSIKANVPVKDIMDVDTFDIDRFQNLRNKMFMYVLKNWKNIIRDINTVKKELQKDGSYGRKADILSIILGIIQHFKGEKYSNNVMEYINSKAQVDVIEHTQTMEEIILTTLVKDYVKWKKPIIDISNTDLHMMLCTKLGFTNPRDKYAPSNQKPRAILHTLGLIPKKENCGYTRTGGRKFHIHLDDIKFVLKRDGYEKLLEEIGSGVSGNTQSSQTTQSSQYFTDGTDGTDGTESTLTTQVGMEIDIKWTFLKL